MKVAVIVSTPAQYHFYKNIIRDLERRGNEVRVLYRDYGETLEVAEIEGEVFSRVRTNWDRILKLPLDVVRARKILKGFKPDVVTGFEIYAPYIAKVLGSRSFVFYDSEPRSSRLLAIQMKAYLPFVDSVITPYTYLDDLGKRHLRVNSFKELAYLHPKYFNPDPSILDELGVDEGGYAILRFNAFDAAHDIGVGGFSYRDKVELVNRLKEDVDVVISSEGCISRELEKYVLRISKKKIHHAIYFAKLLVTDTQTMAFESAILGTPTIRSNKFVDPKREMGNFIELERHGLLINIKDPRKAIELAEQMAKNDRIKEIWKRRKKKFLKDKIDITKFMVWFIENYPDSLREFKENPEIQFRFR